MSAVFRTGNRQQVTGNSGNHSCDLSPVACLLWPRAFTLIELLVIIAIVAILAAILFPLVLAAKDSGRQARCASQLRQLAAAALSYADDHAGRYVPAAKDIYSSNPTGGRWRWHGYREKSKTDFDPRKGPLWTYMSRSGGLKQCPAAAALRNVSQSSGAYESGCGGFGYNYAYVGGTYYRNQPPRAAEEASLVSDLARPSKTVMFADAAMALSYPSRRLIEESFAYAPLSFSTDGKGGSSLTPTISPSIHFRHGGRANVAWCDGHVSAERMSFTRDGSNIYGADNAASGLGWFGPDDNSLFDNR